MPWPEVLEAAGDTVAWELITYPSVTEWTKTETVTATDPTN
jgi:hypothetical protein